MTVAELISTLQKLDPASTVVSFHEIAPQHLLQVQPITAVERIRLENLNWVVLKCEPVSPNNP